MKWIFLLCLLLVGGVAGVLGGIVAYRWATSMQNDVKLVPVDDLYLAERVREAYARKYQLSAPKDPTTPSMRYWRVVPRDR